MLKQNPDKNVILMDGYDLRNVLTGAIDLTDFILSKAAKLTVYAEPFYGAIQYLQDQIG